METSFLASIIARYYPATAEKLQQLVESNVLLKKLSKLVYKKIEASVQEYADIIERIKVVVRMIEAWRNKTYHDIAASSIFIAVAILLYFINPIDLFPDFIPIVGGLDDAILLGFLLKVIDKEIDKFVAWENAFETQKA